MRARRGTRWVVVTWLSLGLAGASVAAEIDTALGPVEIGPNPRSIAVFDIAAIDTLDRLGVPIAGVPDPLYLPQLAGLREDAKIVGTIFEPDLEALSALAPDLIIVGGRSSPRIDATRRVAPSIDMTMDGDDLLEQARARVKTYGILFGAESEATEVLSELDAAVAAARKAVRGKGTALIVMTSGTKISTYGIGSRFGWLHRALGLAPARRTLDAAIHGEAVSFEFLREVDPDWLIVLDRSAAIGSGEQNAKAALDNELVAQTKAWRSEQVIYLPAADFYIAAGGVQATTRVLETITEAFSNTR